MNKRLIAAAYGLMLFMCACSTAWAADSTTTDATSTTTTSTGVAPGTRAASFVVAAVGGTPIAAYRRTIALDDFGAKQWIKFLFHSENESLVPVARVITFPFACVFGIPEGPFYSIHNAWAHSGQEPFSKEAFSIGAELESE